MLLFDTPDFVKYGWTCDTCEYSGDSYCKESDPGPGGYPKLPQENGCDKHCRMVIARKISMPHGNWNRTARMKMKSTEGEF